MSRPTPRGEVGGFGRGGVQTHIREGSGPGPGGGGVSQHSLRHTLQQTATTAHGMHPTGMHSCFFCNGCHWSPVADSWGGRHHKYLSFSCSFRQKYCLPLWLEQPWEIRHWSHHQKCKQCIYQSLHLHSPRCFWSPNLMKKHPVKITLLFFLFHYYLLCPLI